MAPGGKNPVDNATEPTEPSILRSEVEDECKRIKDGKADSIIAEILKAEWKTDNNNTTPNLPTCLFMANRQMA